MAKMEKNIQWLEAVAEIVTEHKKSRISHSINEFRGDVQSVSEYVSLLGRKKAVAIRNHALLLDYLSQFPEFYKIQELIIPQGNKKLLALFGSHQNVSKVVESAIRVDLLKCVNPHYDSRLRVAKRYIVNPNVVKLI